MTCLVLAMLSDLGYTEFVILLSLLDITVNEPICICMDTHIYIDFNYDVIVFI